VNYQQLQALWIARGGDPAMAPIMAAIALAESTGDVTDTTGDGGTSYGLYQIHWTVHPQFNPAQLTNANYNTDAAIQLSGNGKDLSPWTTWKSYVAGYGHGYDVISKLLGPYTGKIPTSSASGSTTSSTSGSSTSSTSGGSSTSSGAWSKNFEGMWFGLGPPTEEIASAAIVGAFALAALLIGGIWLIMGNASTRTIAVNTTKAAAKTAAIAG
jgi:hypothetical protein